MIGGSCVPGSWGTGRQQAAHRWAQPVCGAGACTAAQETTHDGHLLYYMPEGRLQSSDLVAYCGSLGELGRWWVFTLWGSH